MSFAPVGYRSTRAPDGESVSFDDAVLSGLAPDGGLYLPDRMPQAPSGWEEEDDPAALAAVALAPFVGRERGAVEPVFRKALDFRLPLVDLGDDLYVLELFHGPTAAFKDVGARSMAGLMEQVMEKRGESATVLVATSGDTGGAVADAFAGLGTVRVAVLYPRGQVSAVQEAQLTAVREGVTAFAVDGTFDDCQRMVKEVLAARELAGQHLSTANSINIARLLPQVVYYMHAWARLRGSGETRVPTFVVPSGNLGNLTAGMMSTDIGGMRSDFVAAHNDNDYFARFLAGEAEPYAFDPSVRTLSNAMDVGGPSNFERLWALRGEDLRRAVKGHAVSDVATKESITRAWTERGYLACPHTAVGLEAAERERAAGRPGPIVVLATAHPAKFPDTVIEAVGVEPPPHPGLERFERAEKRAVPLAADAAALERALTSF